MPVPYNQFRYIFPPRTTSELSSWDDPAMQSWLSFEDAIAQYKNNGSRNVTYVDPVGHVQWWGRHHEHHKGWTPSTKLVDMVRQLALPRGKWNVFDSETLHLKHSGYRNTLYLYDILVYNGEWLIDVNYGERYKILLDVCKGLPFWDFPASSNDAIYVAQNFHRDEWKDAYERVKKTWHEPIEGNQLTEGLVLKRTGPASRLQRGNQEVNNSGWMVRARKGHKNFQGFKG